MRRMWLGLLLGSCGLWGLSGCATGRPTGAWAGASAMRYRPTTPAAAARPIAPAPRMGVASSAAPLSGDREAILSRARSLVGSATIKVEGHRYVSACNGLVEAAYHDVDVNLRALARPGDNAVTALYRAAEHHGRIYRSTPVPGDLVFFRDTYDVNRDARANDGLTHVGLVESVDEAGTVTVIHHVSRGVVRYQMNPDKPSLRRDPETGKVLNDALRAGGKGRAVATTGELFVAFGALLPSTPAMASR